MSEHSPEPWSYREVPGEQLPWQIRDANGEHIASCPSEAAALLICLAVNAVAGVSNETLRRRNPGPRRWVAEPMPPEDSERG
jgi:hypothetical protein